MIEDILKDVKHRMEQAVNHTNGELNKVRTGRANPEMFNSLSVDYYGSMTPMNQVSTIIEKAIMDANMGFTPGNNGTAVLVPVPPLSEERRQELNKFVHQLVEEGKIAIRNVRRDGIHNLHDLEKDGHISEDLIKDNEAEVQKITDDYVGKLDTLQDDKEKEILEV